MATGTVLRGVDSMLAKARSLPDEIEHKLQSALMGIALDVKTDAQSRVPSNTGALSNSAKVYSTGPLSVEISFGGDPVTSAYALAIHEHPSPHSPPSWHGATVNFKRGGPKYLSHALDAAAPKILDRVAQKVKI